MTDGAGDPRAVPDHLIVGQITKPHGTKGEVFVFPMTDRPADVFVTGGTFWLGDEEGELPEQPATCVVAEEPRPFKRGLLVRFEGHAGRSDVEELAGRYLYLPVDRLAPLEEGEVFYHQLLGLAVETVAGEKVGEVREVYETEPSHLLEVRADGGKAHLIPFAGRIVREVDVAGGRLVIDPPPGLLEL